MIRPVTSNTPDAVLWKKRAEPKYTKIECPQLTRNIYERWGLDKNCHYRAFGKTVQADRKLLVLFDFTDPVVYEGLKRVIDDAKQYNECFLLYEKQYYPYF